MRPWVASTQQTLILSQRLMKLIAIPWLQSSWRLSWITRMRLRSWSNVQPTLLLMVIPFCPSVLSPITHSSCQSVHVKWFMKASLIAATILQIPFLSIWGFKPEKQRAGRRHYMAAVSVVSPIYDPSFWLRYDYLIDSFLSPSLHALRFNWSTDESQSQKAVQISSIKETTQISAIYQRSAI